MNYIEGSFNAEPSFKTELGSSIRGALTLSLVILQERFKHIQDYEQLLIIPIVNHLNWDATLPFWRGTIMNESGTAQSRDMNAPCRASLKILLHMVVHWQNLGISREVRDKLEVGLSDIIELAKIACGPARVAFTKEEQLYIHSRLTPLLDILKKLNSKEQAVTYRFILTFNKGECNV